MLKERWRTTGVCMHARLPEVHRWQVWTVRNHSIFVSSQHSEARTCSTYEGLASGAGELAWVGRVSVSLCHHHPRVLEHVASPGTTVDRTYYTVVRNVQSVANETILDWAHLTILELHGIFSWKSGNMQKITEKARRTEWKADGEGVEWELKHTLHKGFNVASYCDCVPDVHLAIVARTAKTVSIDTLSY